MAHVVTLCMGHVKRFKPPKILDVRIHAHLAADPLKQVAYLTGIRIAVAIRQGTSLGENSKPL